MLALHELQEKLVLGQSEIIALKQEKEKQSESYCRCV